MVTNRPRGVLSDADREYLRATEEEREANYSRPARSQRDSAIRERAQEAFRDFQLLCDELEEEKRARIFERPGTIEREKLKDAIADTIQFIYMGLGGAAEFREPLRRGSRNGEFRLRELDSPFEVLVRYGVDTYRADVDALTDSIEAEEWERLDAPDLFYFIRAAREADAIDFDTVREHVDWIRESGEDLGDPNDED